MADVTYVSRVRVEPVEGRVRRAYIGRGAGPLRRTGRRALRSLARGPHSSTLDFLVAAAGG